VIDAVGEPESLLVFGGTSEIGLAIALRLISARTRRVGLVGRDLTAIATAAARLRAAGATEVLERTFDATSVGEHEALVEELFGARDWDVVLLAFGVLPDQLKSEADPDLAVQVAETNYVGVVSLALRSVRRLRSQGHGVLVLLSSVAGERPRRSNFVYGSSKAGADALVTGVGDAMRGSGARVLVVRPGFVRDRMTEGLVAPPLATTPTAVAEAVAQALARGTESVWVPGHLRWVMSGLRHLPRGVFRRLDL
jgi:decaprenylphospho-beta-D-erythro-pentofuranosid-2-ulose 2-reductase